RGLGIGWLWSSYNLLMLGLALLILLDAPRPSPYEWFNLRRIAHVKFPPVNGVETSTWGTTTMISEVGAEIELTKADTLPAALQTGQTIDLELVDEHVTLPATLVNHRTEKGLPVLTFQFATLNLPQQRRLIELLFCRPGQWQSRCSPNELQSLWLILKSVIRPRFLTERRVNPKPVMLTRG
ncbi:MAG: PilZ domain-containing protein, partial [Cyanobacteria bacterium P01_C01_bin.70]